MSEVTKAAELVEALPWLERFNNAIVVIKYGGHAMADPDMQQCFANDVTFLRYVGLQPVVVHGGGPQITAHLQRLGMTSEFRGGFRVTNSETIDIVRMVLIGQINNDLVRLINRRSTFAIGLSGHDGGLLTARPRRGAGGGTGTDLGLVGDVVAVNLAMIHALLKNGHIPVIASIAGDAAGQTYNVNADSAAAALAVSLGATKLVMLTDVAGLYADWPEQPTLIKSIDSDRLAALLPHLSSGMAPKMQACLSAVSSGVRQAHVVDGRVSHALLGVFTEESSGTVIVPAEVRPQPGAGQEVSR